jgi:hypothetical protein
MNPDIPAILCNSTRQFSGARREKEEREEEEATSLNSLNKQIISLAPLPWVQVAHPLSWMSLPYFKRQCECP